MNIYKKGAALFILGCCLNASIYSNQSEQKQQSLTNAIPPSRPVGGNESNSFYIGGDYILWVPYTNNLQLSVGKGSVSEKGEDITAPTYATSGFKVRAGVNTPHDNWCFGATYTLLSMNRSPYSNPLVSGEEYFFSYEGTHEYSSVVTNYKVDFNRVDAQINRSYYISNYITLKPWLGLLGAWDQQTLIHDAERLSDPVVSQYGKVKQNWWGVGPYTGAEGRYFFNDNLGLYISSGLAILLCEHTIYPYYVNTTSNVADIRQNSKTNYFNAEPMFEIALGFQVESFFKAATLSLNVGWELQVYIEHNSLPKEQARGINAAGFAMQGLTVGGTISF